MSGDPHFKGATPETLARALLRPVKPHQKPPLKVIAGAPDRPLVINNIAIPCFVLEDKTRVLSQRGVFSSVNATRGGPRGQSDIGAQIPRFASQRWLNPYISNELALALKSPILFRIDTGLTAYGYPAELLVDLLDAILQAHADGATTARQENIVTRVRILSRGLGKIGIIGLVDEATGYQRIREERALATILEKFIVAELQPWTKTFPFEFYTEICRLKGWPSIRAVKRPSVIGIYTNDFVYDRLAPALRKELQRRNPSLPTGTRKHKHHQWFTPEHGHPKLREHLAGVTMLMRSATSWRDFRRRLDAASPKFGTTIPLNLDDPEDCVPNDSQDGVEN